MEKEIEGKSGKTEEMKTDCFEKLQFVNKF